MLPSLEDMTKMRMMRIKNANECIRVYSRHSNFKIMKQREIIVFALWDSVQFQLWVNSNKKLYFSQTLKKGNR